MTHQNLSARSMKDARPAPTTQSVADELKTGPGFVSVPAADFRSLTGEAALGAWTAFARSWDHLRIDQFMAGGGRFRRRRFGRFLASQGTITREPHGPHFQDRTYNPLNGGIDRWFEPVSNAIGAHPITTRLLELCVDVFSRASGSTAVESVWKIEMHQFRIEPGRRESGKPTPEGMHRDGVDWVLVVLIGRTGVAGGVTDIADSSGRSLGAFTLTEPLDAVFLDDRRVRHGVTPLEILAPGRPAHRDVLVLTLRQRSS